MSHIQVCKQIVWGEVFLTKLVSFPTTNRSKGSLFQETDESLLFSAHVNVIIDLSLHSFSDVFFFSCLVLFILWDDIIVFLFVWIVQRLASVLWKRMRNQIKNEKLALNLFNSLSTNASQVNVSILALGDNKTLWINQSTTLVQNETFQNIQDDSLTFFIPLSSYKICVFQLNVNKDWMVCYSNLSWIFQNFDDMISDKNVFSHFLMGLTYIVSATSFLLTRAAIFVQHIRLLTFLPIDKKMHSHYQYNYHNTVKSEDTDCSVCEINKMWPMAN